VSAASIITLNSVKKCGNVHMAKVTVPNPFWAVILHFFYVDFYLGVECWVQQILCLVNFFSTLSRLLSSVENVKR